MATHRLTPSRFFTTLGSHEPVLRIADGDRVIAATLDASGVDEAGAVRVAGSNPMTGPIFVEGAEPGDALQVTVEALRPNRATGWSRAALAPNVVDPETVSSLPPRDAVDWAIDAAAGTVRLLAPFAERGDLVLPLAPMIGCFGVAPAGGEAISTTTSGPHGGNMDWRGFGPGVSVAFPVGAPGALFFLGDGHVRQGDGEIVGTGVETSFEMTVVLRVQKGRTIAWPRGEDAFGIFTIGNARPLDQALQHATTEMLHRLGEEYGLDPAAASHLLGQAVRYEIANVFNPAYSVVCRVPADVLPEPRK
ncbi:MAG TPA: acetamidase/formamidase family protein [Thermomicrobiales bacterium]|jgi:acetamidase/formamidase|nr:acetamidase/formamidase family protein [Thermomicrobiales bacterium]